MPHDNDAALLALDWGTSALRAWTLTADGAELATLHRPDGLRSIIARADAERTTVPEAFAAVLRDVRASLGALSTPALACGMVGADGGWFAAGRVDVPTPATATALVPEPVPGQAPPLLVVPGLRSRRRPGAGVDVIRGEETQVVGALSRVRHHGPMTIVLPGTHTKWVQIKDESVQDFSTVMTGELHAALLSATIVGAGPRSRDVDDAAFDAGVTASLQEPDTPLAARLFGGRTRVLAGELAATQVSAYLSGVLIADEVGRALAGGLPIGTPDSLVLCSDGAMGDLYQRVLARLGRDVTVLPGSALDGLKAVARAHDLLPTPVQRPASV